MDFQDVPEQYKIPSTNLHDYKEAATGAGNFATKIVKHLYPELFGRNQLCKNYNVYGLCNKLELHPARREVVERYTTAYYPNVKSNEDWKPKVVPKINEYLRRPNWSNRKTKLVTIVHIDHDDEGNYLVHLDDDVEEVDYC